MRHIVAGLVALTAAGLASASTDCTSMVTSVLVETGKPGAGYIVTMSSGVSIGVSPKTVNRQGILEMAMRSQSLADQLTLRFAADGVDCKKAALRADLIAVVLSREEPVALMITPPATVVTTPTPRP